MSSEAGIRPFWARTKAWFVRVWHTKDARVAIARDVAVAGGIILVLLAGLWLYAGQPLSRSPVVSVESGSMMHGPGSPTEGTRWSEPPFGRIGTIDPGDIVVVRDVDRLEDIEVVFDADAKTRYGAPGDVVVYAPYGRTESTRIIHRAVLLVVAEPEGCMPNVDCKYRIPAACEPAFATWNRGPDLSRYCAGSSEPIDLDLVRAGIALRATDYPCAVGGSCAPFFSSLLTKGDNNPSVDQSGSISDPVRFEWIIGKARLEMPWFGLIKLMLVGNDRYQPGTDPSERGNWGFLNADAPSDIWTCLFVTVGVLIVLPTAIERVARLRRRGDT